MDGEKNESGPRPLQYQRAFGGAGIKRKRVDFVAESKPSALVATTSTTPSASVKDLYLSIVLPSQSIGSATARQDGPVTSDHNSDAIPGDAEATDAQTTIINCPICYLPISTTHAPHVPHESILAHQLSLPHTHPPSHIDRRRKGLTYLNSYGWDPDARTGLGAVGEGRLYPVKVKKREHQDHTGIGVDIVELEAEKKREAERKPVTKKTVAGKKQRKLQEQAKLKDKKMRDLFYGRDDVNKYLGIEL